MAVYKVTGGYLDVEAQGGGDHIWGPTDPRPTPPIVIPPDAISPGVPTHPIYIPVYPAHPIVIPPGSIGGGDPPVPAHPIVLPPYVPGHPIVIPPGSIDGVHPEHPIVLPEPPLTIWGPPTMPPGFWGGGMGPGVKPQPPLTPPTTPAGAKWVFSPVYGWVIDPSPEGGKPVPIHPPGTSEPEPPAEGGAGRRTK